MKRSTAVWTCLLVVALAPCAVATDAWVEADRVEATGVDALEGGLTFLSLEAPASAGLRLTAEHLRVETDQRSASVGVVQTAPETTTRQHEAASLAGTSTGPDAVATVLPTGARFQVETLGCATLDTPPGDAHTHAPRLDGRPATSVSLKDATALLPCTRQPVEVTGDFLLVLWDWDAVLRSDAGEETLQSGPGDATAGDASARERFLFATNATLRLPAGNNIVYLDDPTVTAHAVHLSAASGILRGTPVSGDVDLYGRLEVTARGNGPGAPLAVSVGGTVSEFFVDDTTIQTSGIRDWGPWPWLALAFVGALLLFLRVRPHLVYWRAERKNGELGTLIPQTVRQRRGVGLWILARAAERRNRFRLSHRRAGRAHDLFRPFPEAQFTRAVAAGHLGFHADAMTDFLDLYNRHDEPAGRAAAACGVAQECCRLKKWEAAREWLERAAFESPEYVRVASVGSDFDHFAGQPWFESLRAGRGRAASGSVAGGPDPSFH